MKREKTGLKEDKVTFYLQYVRKKQAGYKKSNIDLDDTQIL